MALLPFALGLGVLAIMRKGSARGSVQQQAWMRPVSGAVTSKFGPRVHPVTGEVGKMHNGVDLSAPLNTPIYAPADGIVSGRNYNNVGGNQLMIVHTNGMQSGYSHLSKYNVNIGDKVKKGDVIAYSGNTGRSTGPHLHFSVKDKNKNFVDPLKYIPA